LVSENPREQTGVCDPRKNILWKDGNKSDRIDARKLAELLRTNQLKPVCHGEQEAATLKNNSLWSGTVSSTLKTVEDGFCTRLFAPRLEA
jgi:uncharacterized protein YydD (DUF2326 family)